MHWDVGQGKSWIFFLNTGLPFPPKAVSLGRTRGTARKSPRATLVASRTKWWLTKPQKTWRTLEQLTEAQSLKRHVLLCGMAAKKTLSLFVWQIRFGGSHLYTTLTMRALPQASTYIACWRPVAEEDIGGDSSLTHSHTQRNTRCRPLDTHSKDLPALGKCLSARTWLLRLGFTDVLRWLNNHRALWKIEHGPSWLRTTAYQSWRSAWQNTCSGVTHA